MRKDFATCQVGSAHSPNPEAQLRCITGEALTLSPGHTKKSISNGRTNQTLELLLPAGCISALLHGYGLTGHTDHGPAVPHTATWVSPPNSAALKKLVTEACGIHPSTQKQPKQYCKTHKEKQGRKSWERLAQLCLGWRGAVRETTTDIYLLKTVSLAVWRQRRLQLDDL